MNKAAQQLGRLGGKKTSEAKAQASRDNGKKGGRPKAIKLKVKNGEEYWPHKISARKARAAFLEKTPH